LEVEYGWKYWHGWLWISMGLPPAMFLLWKGFPEWHRKRSNLYKELREELSLAEGLAQVWFSNIESQFDQTAAAGTIRAWSKTKLEELSIAMQHFEHVQHAGGCSTHFQARVDAAAAQVSGAKSTIVPLILEGALQAPDAASPAPSAAEIEEMQQELGQLQEVALETPKEERKELKARIDVLEKQLREKTIAHKSANAGKEERLTITVRGDEGDVELEMQPGDCVETLRRGACSKLGMFGASRDGTAISFAGQRLHAWTTLEEQDCETGATLHLITLVDGDEQGAAEDKKAQRRGDVAWLLWHKERKRSLCSCVGSASLIKVSADDIAALNEDEEPEAPLTPQTWTDRAHNRIRSVLGSVENDGQAGEEAGQTVEMEVEGDIPLP